MHLHVTMEALLVPSYASYLRIRAEIATNLHSENIAATATARNQGPREMNRLVWRSDRYSCSQTFFFSMDRQVDGLGWRMWCGGGGWKCEWGSGWSLSLPQQYKKLLGNSTHSSSELCMHSESSE